MGGCGRPIVVLICVSLAASYHMHDKLLSFSLTPKPTTIAIIATPPVMALPPIKALPPAKPPVVVAPKRRKATVASFGWDIATRQLRIDENFTQSQARACLENKNITMIGDSLTRYQYLNLVHYLATGQWSSPHPANEREGDHKDWNSFYETTNARLGGREICDCYRKDHVKNVEQRYFIDGNVRVSYRQAYGPQSPVAFHKSLDLNVASCERVSGGCQQTACKPGACGDAPDKPGQAWPAMLSEMLTDYPATDLIINAGHWWPSGLSPTELAQISNKSLATRVHWKTTTASRAPAPKSNVNTSMFYGVFDAGAITAGATMWMWDDLHFEPAVYVGLNQAFLAYMCSMSL